MSLRYHIDADAGLINMTGNNQLCFADLLRCTESLLNDSAFDPHLPQLVDLRQANFRNETLSENRSLLRLMTRFNERVNANVAVIIRAGLAKHQIAELYRFTCQFNRAELFDDLDHAMRWLIKTEFVTAAAQR